MSLNLLHIASCYINHYVFIIRKTGHLSWNLQCRVPGNLRPTGKSLLSCSDASKGEGSRGNGDYGKCGTENHKIQRQEMYSRFESLLIDCTTPYTPPPLPTHFHSVCTLRIIPDQSGEWTWIIKPSNNESATNLHCPRVALCCVRQATRSVQI